MDNPPIIAYKGTYKMFDPDKVAYVERDDYMKSVINCLNQEPQALEPEPIEKLVLDQWKAQLFAKDDWQQPAIIVTPAVARLARDYTRYAKDGARLPKFSRWASGLFPNDKEIPTVLAKVGQLNGKRGGTGLRFSGSAYDILRAATSPHYYSCLTCTSATGQTLLRMADQCPGIAIAFIDDEAGHMRGRNWMYHAKLKDTGEDIVVLSNRPYGNITVADIAKPIKDAGFKVYQSASNGYYAAKNAVPIAYENCFKEYIYNDTNTTDPKAVASPL